MCRELTVARGDGSLYGAIDHLAKVDLLIIDDFLTTPIQDGRNVVDLFEILEAREGRGSTMISSQLEPDQWYLRINEDLCADPILNRIVEHARFVDIKGPNMGEWTAGQRAGDNPDYWK